jgi:hypothetical protein
MAMARIRGQSAAHRFPQDVFTCLMSKQHRMLVTRRAPRPANFPRALRRLTIKAFNAAQGHWEKVDRARQSAIRTRQHEGPTRQSC